MNASVAQTAHEVCTAVLLSLFGVGLLLLVLGRFAKGWRPRLQGILQGSAAALFGVVWITDALVTGETSFKRVSVTRQDDPILFWCMVSGIAFVLVVVPAVLLLAKKPPK